MARKWQEMSLKEKGLVLGLGINLAATVTTLIAIWKLAAELASRIVP